MPAETETVTMDNQIIPDNSGEPPLSNSELHSRLEEVVKIPDDLVGLNQNLWKQAKRSLQIHSVKECERLAEWAVKTPIRDALDALHELIKVPSPWTEFRRHRRAEWVTMRLTAIHAIDKIHDASSTIPLANSVLLDEPDVRTRAAQALCNLGEPAVLPIVECIRTAKDWSLGGMVELISVLRRIKSKSSGPTLAKILFGLLPLSPSRWTRWQLSYGAVIGAIFTGLISISMIAAHFEWWMLISLTFMFCFLTVLASIAMSGVSQVKKRFEADALNDASSAALISIADIRSIPSLIEVATEKYSSSARLGAARALTAILPLVGPADMGLLDGPAERRLNGMFATHDAELCRIIVRSLEFIGTGASVGPVERLTRRRPLNHDAGAFSELRIEAERVLPILVERKRQEEAASVLLRASQVSPDSGAVLLRAVATTSSYDEPEQLLRPGQAE